MRSIAYMILVVMGAFAGAGRTSAQTAAVRPSFDCARAVDVIEQTICGDPKLPESDSVMARLFAAVRTSAFGEGPSSELAIQRNWLKEREACRQFEPRVYHSRADCLEADYKYRNHDLAIAALFAEPELALNTLRKLDPEAAPLYEAIFDYVSAPTVKRAEIERLLQPYFARFNSNDELSYGKNILGNINTPAGAIKSPKNFATFLEVQSVYLESYDTKTLPCAALVLRPALLAAEGPMFGSTMDNFTFRSDCPDTLPGLPRLDALVKAINDSWPNCEGTIRFAAFRNFATTLDAARLGGNPRRGEDWIEDARDRDGQLKGVPRNLVSDAIDELTRYYARYHRTAGHPARNLAVLNIRAILRAGHSCGG